MENSNPKWLRVRATELMQLTITLDAIMRENLVGESLNLGNARNKLREAISCIDRARNAEPSYCYFKMHETF